MKLKAIFLTGIKTILFILAIVLMDLLMDFLGTLTGNIAPIVLAVIAVCVLLWLTYKDSLRELEDN